MEEVAAFATWEAESWSSGTAAEGAFTARQILALAEERRVLMPIMTAVAVLLEGEIEPSAAVSLILGLPMLPE